MKAKADPVRSLSQAFLNRFGQDCGRRLEEVLPDLGLQVLYRNARSYEGALLRVKGAPRGYVVLSQDIREDSRRRFTLAHEIGHYLLPDQQNLAQPCGSPEIESWDDDLVKPEKDANRFAAEILMPRSLVKTYLRESPRLDHVAQIAETCATSLTASAYRLVELSSYRAAIVWSQAGSARWYKASDEFVRWVRMGELSPDSFAFDAFEGERIPACLESVPASAWLFERGLKPDARILEHSLPLPGYDAVLTLLVIPERIQDWDDSNDSRSIELDPDEFTLHRSTWPGRRR